VFLGGLLQDPSALGGREEAADQLVHRVRYPVRVLDVDPDRCVSDRYQGQTACVGEVEVQLRRIREAWLASGAVHELHFLRRELARPAEQCSQRPAAHGEAGAVDRQTQPVRALPLPGRQHGPAHAHPVGGHEERNGPDADHSGPPTPGATSSKKARRSAAAPLNGSWVFG